MGAKFRKTVCPPGNQGFGTDDTLPFSGRKGRLGGGAQPGVTKQKATPERSRGKGRISCGREVSRGGMDKGVKFGWKKLRTLVELEDGAESRVNAPTCPTPGKCRRKRRQFGWKTTWKEKAYHIGRKNGTVCNSVTSDITN